MVSIASRSQITHMFLVDLKIHTVDVKWKLDLLVKPENHSQS